MAAFAILLLLLVVVIVAVVDAVVVVVVDALPPPINIKNAQRVRKASATRRDAAFFKNQ